MKPRVMIIEGCDFQSFPVGGQLTHAIHWIQVFGGRLALVGVSTDDTPVGVWTKKEFHGVVLDYFSIGRSDPAIGKPLLPRRLTVLLALKRHKKQILSLGIGSAFVMAPEAMLAVASWGLRICYKFSGVENPLSMPRYEVGRLLATRFENLLFARLAAHAELIIAASDRIGIDRMVARSNGVLSSGQVVQFSTRVDTSVFQVRQQGTPECAPVFVTCGRLNHVKGWDLILDAFIMVKKELPDARLCFLGDGEDHPALAGRIASAGLQDAVTITGFLPAPEVASKLNDSRVYLMGSHREGWPIALLEALACGLPAVCTRVSGTDDLIEPGRNGYVVDSRDPGAFADRMLAALHLDNPNLVSLEIAQRHALDRLGDFLQPLWEPLRG